MVHSACEPTPAPEITQKQLIFLGTGAGGGVPTFYCGCKACEEARANAVFQRTRCSLLFKGALTTLIDAPPDLRVQLVREAVDRIDRFFLTHWHYDHIGGLGELEYYVRVKRQAAIPAFMTSETEEKLRSAFGYMLDCFKIKNITCGERIEADGLGFTALDVQHAPGTIGFLIDTLNGKRIAYLPDTGPLLGKTAHLLREVDVLILDATFWGRSIMPEVHQSVESAVRIGLKLNAGEIYLTHLSMHHERPVTHQELQNFLREYEKPIHVAHDGLRLDI